jgi:hypothetical protein
LVAGYFFEMVTEEEAETSEINNSERRSDPGAYQSRNTSDGLAPADGPSIGARPTSLRREPPSAGSDRALIKLAELFKEAPGRALERIRPGKPDTDYSKSAGHPPRESKQQLSYPFFSAQFRALARFRARGPELCDCLRPTFTSASIGKAQSPAITGSLARHDPAADACELGEVP